MRRGLARPGGMTMSVPRPKSDTVQLAAFRVPRSWIGRLDALSSAVYAQPGMAPSRADVARVALGRGIETLEAQYGIEPSIAPDPLPKPKTDRRKERPSGGGKSSG